MKWKKGRFSLQNEYCATSCSVNIDLIFVIFWEKLRVDLFWAMKRPFFRSARKVRFAWKISNFCSEATNYGKKEQTTAQQLQLKIKSFQRSFFFLTRHISEKMRKTRVFHWKSHFFEAIFWALCALFAWPTRYIQLAWDFETFQSLIIDSLNLKFSWKQCQ